MIMELKYSLAAVSNKVYSTNIFIKNEKKKIIRKTTFTLEVRYQN